MTPERWQQVKGVLQNVLERAPSERAAFLDQACDGDQALRQEVESLLASDEQGRSSFLQSPLSLRLVRGTRLGDYEIQSLLGAGGMGEVYRARDLRLRRDVAVKVLPAFVASDPDRLRRFEQEATAAAALNHPNILAVYQMGTNDGAPYLVSELLEGETLREQMKHGPMAVRRAMDYGIQIARGLAVAHEKGIVHRDLKPENLFVTKDGRVKILDFGLAKLTQPQHGSEHSSPTLGAETEAGLVMGTVGYMAPEQVRGQAADHRADIFAFGAILYEMLAGKRAFQKPTSPETMTAILNEDPPGISQVVPNLPPALQRVVHRCLEKNPEQRFQSASDLAFALEALSGSERSSAISAGGRRGLQPIWRQMLAAAVVLFLGATGAVWWATRQPVVRHETAQRQLTANSSESAIFTGKISPDGNYLAYIDLKGLHVESLATGDVRTIPAPTGVEPAGIGPWFPDGTRFFLIARRPRPSTWVISLLGETARKAFDDYVVDAISPDGSRLAGFRKGAAGGEVWIMDPNGEHQQRFLGVPDSQTSFGGVRWSPDCKRLAYVLIRTLKEQNKRELIIESRDLQGQSPATILSNPDLADFQDQVALDFEWLTNGRVVYSSFDRGLKSDNLWEVEVDSGTGKPQGQPRRLTNWAGFHLDSISATTDHRSLVFRRWAIQSSVYISAFDRSGISLTEPRRLTFTETESWPMSWTADGKTVVLMSNRNGHWGIFKQALGADSAELLVAGRDGAEIDSPRVSPDGSWVVYLEVPKQGWESSPSRMMRIPILGGPPEYILSGRILSGGLCSAVPNGSCFIAEESSDPHQLVISAVDPLKGRGRVVAHFAIDPAATYHWSVSPDGNYIAVVKDGVNTIRLMPTRDGKAHDLVVKGSPGLHSLDFSADGKSFFASTSANGKWALLKIDSSGSVHSLFSKDSQAIFWGVPSRDGKQIALLIDALDGNMWMLKDF